MSHTSGRTAYDFLWFSPVLNSTSKKPSLTTQFRALAHDSAFQQRAVSLPLENVSLLAVVLHVQLHAS